MAKKRIKRASKRSRKINRAQKKVQRAKFMPYSKTANVLSIISVFILIINAFALIFFKEAILETLSEMGTVLSSSYLALIGLIWLLIAFFAWSINRTIKEKQSKVAMWELFILSIVTFLTGRIESGVLLLIASVIYLVKAKK
ncbi:MAG: hypothetical protein KKE23_00620 [Nanoarchaeota archaeon]|nr:hypothetical protein [Nanoarchaeota archaeon]